MPSQSSRLQLQSTSPTGLPLTEADATSLHPWTVLIACGFLAFLNRKVLRRYFRIAVGGSQLETSLAIYRAYKDNVSEAAPHTTPRADLEMPMSTGVETISKGRLRRRGRVSQQKDIWTAAANGDVEEVQRNLDNKVDVHARSKHHSTPLSVAAFHSQPFVAELLLKYDSKQNHDIAGFHGNVLHAAATARLLLKYGADISDGAYGLARDGAALSKGIRSLVRIFLGHGINRITIPRSISSVHDSSCARCNEQLAWREGLRGRSSLHLFLEIADCCEKLPRDLIQDCEGSVPQSCNKIFCMKRFEQNDYDPSALKRWDTRSPIQKERHYFTCLDWL